jgi:hypothetical protein
MDYQIKFKNKENCENVVLSSYFITSKKLLPENNFNVIKKIYSSFKHVFASKPNTHLRIFHDHLNTDFIKKHSTKKIKFIKVNTKNIYYDVNDILFFSAQQFIQYNLDIKNLFIIGHSDVTIKNDPFTALNIEHNEDALEDNHHPLFISQESTILSEDSIFFEKLKTLDIDINDILSGDKDTLKIRPLLSSKILGGNRDILYHFFDLVLPFVKHINDRYKEFTKNKKAFSTSSNKTALNYYGLFEKNIITGFPFYITKTEYDSLNVKEKQAIMFTIDTI